MRIEQRNIYIAEDGKEFDSEEACSRYEKEDAFMRIVWNFIERYADDYYDADTKEDISRVVASRFPELIERYNEL